MEIKPWSFKAELVFIFFFKTKNEDIKLSEAQKHYISACFMCQAFWLHSCAEQSVGRKIWIL